MNLVDSVLFTVSTTALAKTIIEDAQLKGISVEESVDFHLEKFMETEGIESYKKNLLKSSFGDDHRKLLLEMTNEMVRWDEEGLANEERAEAVSKNKWGKKMIELHDKKVLLLSTQEN